MPMLRLTLVLLLSLLCAVVAGSPAASASSKRELIDPQILTPTAGAIWVVGEQATVTWNTTGLPSSTNITDTSLIVMLGVQLSNGGFHIFINDTPLVDSVSIYDGKVTFTVPIVTPATDYIIALMGDSGNISPPFTIENASTHLSSSLSGSSSITLTTSTSSSPSVTTSSTTDTSDRTIHLSTNSPSTGRTIYLSTYTTSVASSSPTSAPSSTQSSSTTLNAPAPSNTEKTPDSNGALPNRVLSTASSLLVSALTIWALL